MTSSAGVRSGTLRIAWAPGLVFLLLFLLSVAAEAVDNPPPSDARFVHFTVESGLSQNTVRAILQDSHGFLWFATEEGLNRYDGYTFSIYKHHPEDASTLPSNMVTALYEDRAGQLWVGTHDGLCVYDAKADTFTLRLPVHEDIMAIVQDRRDRLWIATAGEGVYQVDKKLEPVHYTAGEADGLAHNNVYSILEDRSGRIWVGTFGGGLDLLNAAGDGFVHHQHDPKNPASLAYNEIWSLAEDASGNIWVATNGSGVSVLDPARSTFHHFRSGAKVPNGLPGDMVTSLYVDRAGTLWLGTDPGGLSYYVPQQGAFISYQHAPDVQESLGQGSVRAIYEDVQRNLWVSTFSAGINWLHRNAHPFQLYTRRPQDRNSLAGGGVAAFLQDRDGTLWVGAEGWLNRFDPDTGSFQAYPIGPYAILRLFQDHQGRIWVGTWGRGLLRFDPIHGLFTPYESGLNNPSTRGDKQVWSIDEDASGNLWLATDAGAFRIDAQSGRLVRYAHDAKDPGSLGHDRTRAFHWAPDGNLWVATFGGGISVLPRDGKSFAHYRHEPTNRRSLSNDLVLCLHRDRVGRLWVGTFGGGLNLFDPADRSFTVYGEADGLPSNTVYAILEDDQGRLWLSTNKGLCRFDPNTKGHPVETFDTTNGLQSLHFNLAAALRTKSGNMLFGTWNGFYSFDPNRITPNPHVPPIVLTSLEVLNEPRKTEPALPLADTIKVKYDEKILTFQFAVLDYTFPRRNNYKYKLDGFNDDWISIGGKREVTFTNLDPGHYTLHVIGSNSDGVWDDKGRSLRLVIPPPYWMTLWFRALVVGVILGAAYGFYRYRIEWHEARERELEDRVEEALSKVKVLKGLLPICATCKKVRDDRGYWSQIESYLRTHTEADFSHGICPECIVKYWGSTRAAAGVTTKKRES
jgi:ligand-binding sensor domain-containing protein